MSIFIFSAFRRISTHNPPSSITLLNLCIVTANMDFQRSERLNCIGLLKLVKDRGGVSSYNEYIIGMRPDIIVASLAPPNPDIRFKMSWLKTHFPQGMR